MNYFIKIIIGLLAFNMLYAQNNHPRLILTSDDVKKIRKNIGQVPLFDITIEKAKREIDNELNKIIDVPKPMHEAGGYTHEQHKRNFLNMQKAGVLFQITTDTKYAKYVKDILLIYAKKYPTWGLHPSKKSYAPGRVFWQSLNDANWLVYTSQAYDCIYNYLTEKERSVIEKDLFYPFAKHISEDSPQFFNRIHNHSTWATAAVGMIGLVMNDDKLLNHALYGLNTDNDSSKEIMDDDGGFLFSENNKGFIANLESPFSPDGYLTEGPYYQRYAMYPFMTFAVSLYNSKKSNLFNYKNDVLVKAVETLIQLSNSKGEFFPINDAQKGMSIFSRELITAVSNAYYYGNKNSSLLDIAIDQERVSLDSAGFAVALDIENGFNTDFVKKSVSFGDGSNGNKGGLAVIRSDNIELLYKYTSHGLSHGHYDKLTYLYYVNGEEMVQDYGLARFVNIEQKNGGGYLKENKTWAKQTIAHNTLSVNQKTQFNGSYKLASQNHSKFLFKSFENENLKVVSAIEDNAYPGTTFQRTFFVLKDVSLSNSVVFDIINIYSEEENNYDLPFYFVGQPIEHNIIFKNNDTLTTFGLDYGYQHLWNIAEGKSKDDLIRFNWLKNNVFLTKTSINQIDDQQFFVRIGANDPDFNLRNDPGLITRRNAKSTVFISSIEAHGKYSPVSEFATNSRSEIKNLKQEFHNNFYTSFSVELLNNTKYLFIIAHNSDDTEKKHSLTVGTDSFNWKGPYYFKKL